MPGKDNWWNRFLKIRTTQPVMPGVATSAAAFNRDIPREESTVGDDLGYAGALLASPLIGTSFAKNMLVGIPAFDVADRVPTLIGQDRATVQAGNLLESGFRAVAPDGKFEESAAPYVNQLGMVVGGLPIGGIGEATSRLLGDKVASGLGKAAAKSFRRRASFFEPVADAYNSIGEQQINIPDRYWQKNIVNPDGSINKDELISGYRDILRYYNSITPSPNFYDISIPDLQGAVIDSATGLVTWPNLPFTGYKSHLTSLRKIMKENSLRDHIAGVVKTAQEIPVPEGSSRAELVRAALTHDIGKVYTGQEPTINPDHPILARKALENIGRKEFESPTLLSAVQYHMDDSHLPIYGSHGMSEVNIGNDKYPMNWDLLHALQASDVARGLSYDQAAMKYPQLFTYSKANMPKVQLYSGTEEEQLKNVINPILLRQGYPTVKNEEGLNKRLHRHRSFLRGNRDPQKPQESANQQSILNAQNAAKLAERDYGENNAHNRMLVAASTVPLAPTGYGRASVFGRDPLAKPAKHTPGPLSQRLKISPEFQDVLYVSASPETMSNYGTPSSAAIRDAMHARITLPLSPKEAGESLVDFMERGNFQLYNGENIISGTSPMSDWQLLEEPYRLQTGRSLQRDMSKEYIGPKREKISRSHYKGRGEEPAPWGDKDDIYDYIKQQDQLISLAKETAEKTGVDISNIFKRKEIDGVEKVLVGGRENWLKSRLELVNSGKVSTNDARLLYTEGIISKETLKTHQALTRKFFKSGKVADKDKLVEFDKKYILGSGTVHKLRKMYSESLRPRYKAKPDYMEYMSRDSKLKYMREHGVAPLWEMPSFGKTEIFSTNGGHWGASLKTRSFSPSDVAPQGVVVGKQGERIFDVRPFSDEEIQTLLKGWKKPKGWKSGRRDAGNRYTGEEEPFAITRKTYSDGGLLEKLQGLYGENALDAIREFKAGGKIYIKPFKRGTFTAAAKNHGKSVQAFAYQVLAHKGNYSPAMVKKANFARNAAKWHGDGGILDRLDQHFSGDTEAMLNTIRKAKGR